MHSSTWAATEPTAQKETAKRYGNVQSLLEAIRPNGFDRRISGLSQAARGSDDDVRAAAMRPHKKIPSKRLVAITTAGRFHLTGALFHTCRDDRATIGALSVEQHTQ
jgi:hypothetical protein